MTVSSFVISHGLGKWGKGGKGEEGWREGERRV